LHFRLRQPCLILQCQHTSAGTRQGCKSCWQASEGNSPIELGCVEPQGLVEGCPLVVVQVHGDVHRQAEETAPHL
jgi:hypothetical protein